MTVLGALGSFIITSSIVPQILKVYRTKLAQDISLAWQILYLSGLTLFVVYGFGRSLWPIYIPVSIDFAANLILLVLKLHYDRKSPILLTPLNSLQ